MIYRKWGRSVRWENGVIVRVEEAGEAREENGVFIAQPIGDVGRASAPPGGLKSAPRPTLPDEVLRFAQDVRSIERIVALDGVAIHECDGVRWTDRTRRLHVALVNAPWRALIDLAKFDLALVRRVADALARCEGTASYDHLRLAPHVAAAFVAHLSCKREQMPAPHDGSGRRVRPMDVDGDPPNVYRPSYRVRPVAAWLNVRAVPFGLITRHTPEAIAIIDAPRPTFLVQDGRRVFVAEHDLAPSAVGPTEGWYPFGAGAFGAEVIA